MQKLKSPPFSTVAEPIIIPNLYSRAKFDALMRFLLVLMRLPVVSSWRTLLLLMLLLFLHPQIE